MKPNAFKELNCITKTQIRLYSKNGSKNLKDTRINQLNHDKPVILEQRKKRKKSGGRLRLCKKCEESAKNILKVLEYLEDDDNEKSFSGKGKEKTAEKVQDDPVDNLDIVFQNYS